MQVLWRIRRSFRQKAMSSLFLWPLILIKGRKLQSYINSKEQNDFEEIGKDSELSTSQSENLPQKKKKMIKIKRELKYWSATLFTNAKRRKEASGERRHREIIAESKVAIDTYKEVMRQLIDKLWFHIFIMIVHALTIRFFSVFI